MDGIEVVDTAATEATEVAATEATEVAATEATKTDPSAPGQTEDHHTTESLNRDLQTGNRAETKTDGEGDKAYGLSH